MKRLTIVLVILALILATGLILMALDAQRAANQVHSENLTLQADWRATDLAATWSP